MTMKIGTIKCAIKKYQTNMHARVYNARIEYNNDNDPVIIVSYERIDKLF